MAIRKLKSSWWVDFRFARQRYRKRSPENSKAGASAYEALLRQKLAHGELLTFSENKSSSMLLFSDFALQWFETYVVPHNKYSEQRNKRNVLRGQLVPFFGSTPIQDISSLQIEAYKVAALKRNLSPKTINNQIGILSKCLRDAQQWGLLNVIPTIKKLRVPPSKFDFLTPNESNRLLLGVHNPLWHTMTLLALRTGLRLSELKGLKWEDIDFERKILAVRRGVVRSIIDSPKSNRERYIPLTEQVILALEKFPLKIGWVFSLRNGSHMQHGAPEKAIKRFCQAAGLRKIGWHTLRHTFASHLIGNGVSIKAVQELLGHADIQTTMRYAHLAPSALRTAIDTLERREDSKIENCKIEKFGQLAVNHEMVSTAVDQSANHFPA